MLLVDVVDDFIDRVNNHTVLRYQLYDGPLTSGEIDFNINFESFFGKFVDPLYIGKAELWNNVPYFYAFNMKNPQADWSSQKFEPFYKSRELARAKEEAETPETEEVIHPPVQMRRPPPKVMEVNYYKLQGGGR